MAARREPVIVVTLAVLSLCPTMAGIMLFPSPSASPAGGPLSLPCPEISTPYPGSVNLTPQSPVLLPMLGRYYLTGSAIGFHLAAPADFSGGWNATAPIDLFVLNFTTESCTMGPPIPPGQLNGTFNVALFPGNYVVRFEPAYGANHSIVATQPWVARFDRGLDVLQPPEQFTLPPDGHLAWPILAPSGASDFFLEAAMTTNSCNQEFAVLSAAHYNAFASDHAPLNGNGTAVLEGGSTPTLCSAVWSGAVTSWWGDFGPYNWTSGDMVVFYNGANETATLYAFGPLEASYRTG